MGYSQYSNFDFNVNHKKIRALTAQKKVYSTLSNLLIHWIYLSAAYFIIVGVILWVTNRKT